MFNLIHNITAAEVLDGMYECDLQAMVTPDWISIRGVGEGQTRVRELLQAEQSAHQKTYSSSPSFSHYITRFSSVDRQTF